jgi:integrase
LTITVSTTPNPLRQHPRNPHLGASGTHVYHFWHTESRPKEAGRVAVNPARLVKHRHEDNGVIRYLTLAEEAKLRTLVQPKHPERWAINSLALHTGCRAGELWGLKWTEVDRTSASPTITLLGTKNGTTRHVPLSTDALVALKDFGADGRN